MMDTNRIMIQMYNRYQLMLKWLLAIPGLWPTEKPSTWYYVRPYTIIFVNSIGLAGMINKILHDEDTDALIKVISFFASLSLSMLKIFMLAIYRKKITIFLKILNGFIEEIFQDTRLIDTSCRNLRVCFRLSYMFTATLLGSFLMILVILPLIHIAIDFIKDPSNAQFHLIFPARYTWNVETNNFNMIITLIFEIYALIGICTAASGIDSFLLFTIFQGTALLRAMSYRLTHVRHGEDYDEILKQCVNEFVTIRKFRDDLEVIFGPIILYNICTSAILMCTLLYQLSQAEESTAVDFIRVAIYMMSKSIQVFIHTWSGTLLHEESEDFLTHVYLSNWLGTKSQRAVYITLFQRPLIMNVCNLLVASVEVFAKTMNTSVSYFLLLKTIA